MNAVIIFELSGEPTPGVIKQAMIDKGYATSWITIDVATKATIDTYNLPNNTLWKTDTELVTALNDLKTTVSAYNTANSTHITILSCITLASSPWNGVPVPK